MKILVTRHGESLYNIENKIGGNSEISKNGEKFGEKLNIFFKNNTKMIPEICYISEKIRAIQTFNYVKKYFKKNNYFFDAILNEINAGFCEDMTYNDVEKKYPEIFQKRLKDKFYYQYPEGESYFDLYNKLQKFCKKIILQNKNILIISHQAILRVIIGILCQININEIPYLKINLHHLISLEKNEKDNNLFKITEINKIY